MPTYIDTHVHTNESRDCFVELEEYLIRIRSQDLPIDGFVVTDHGSIAEKDYRRLSEEYGILVFPGIEAYTNGGHMIVFGIEKHVWENSSNLDKAYINSRQLVSKVTDLGGLVSVCHPFDGPRRFFDLDSLLDCVTIIEEKNGSNVMGADLLAETYRKKHRIYGIGGSDAHYRDDIGLCLTRFEDRITTYQDLLEALRSGNFRAVYLKEAMEERRATRRA